MHLNICSRHNKQMILQDKNLLARYTGRVQTIAIKHDFFKTLCTFAKMWDYILSPFHSQHVARHFQSLWDIPLPGPIII